MSSNVIGEGAYGCIHKPSLKCKDKYIADYKNKVSKLLQKRFADKELSEYSLVESIDKEHSFYLGNPTECSPEKSKQTEDSIKKCKHSEELLKEFDDLALLIMDDGGVNIKDYSDNVTKWKSTKENKQKVEVLWLEFYRIVKAIDIFLKKGVLHLDIKPQNIVLNEETMRLNLIDFGLTATVEEKMKQSYDSKNQTAIYHWSYPFEFHFLNRNVYEDFASKTETEKTEYFETILQNIKEKKKDPDTAAFTHFFSFISNKDDVNIDFIRNSLNGFYATITQQIHKQSYKAFIQKSIQSVDLYGLGITILYMTTRMKHLMDKKLFKQMNDLAYKMIESQLSKRYTIEQVVSEYESILTDSGLLVKYNMNIDKNTVKKTVAEPNVIDNQVKPGEQILKEVSQNPSTSTSTSISTSRVTHRPSINKHLETIHSSDILVSPNTLSKRATSVNAKRHVHAKNTEKKKQSKTKKYTIKQNRE